ncbi:unnamed protein product [Allacma fusca]|uniref:ATP-binding cassette sub-family D member 3 n=1 Tax=Allacma fusca TaxID=39272 RepID=A0A8J2JWR6_9HEXA|nr:unnamed protein product [Allacma fusca]
MGVHSKLLMGKSPLDTKLRVVCLSSSLMSIVFLIKLYKKSRLRAMYKSIFRNQFKNKQERNDFQKKLKQILKLLIPSWTCPEVGYMSLTSIVLVLRSILDVWTIYLGTLLESAIITMDNKRFNHHLLQFAMIMPSMALTNALLKFSTEKLSRRFRTRLTEHITEKYMTELTFYKLSLKSSGIDQLISTDINLFSNTLANLYSQMSKPILDIMIYIYGISSALGASVPMQMIAYLCVAAGILIKMRKPISRLTTVEQELEGEYRYYHNRVITNAEEIAFYGGNKREEDTLKECFTRLVNHSDKFISFRFVISYMENIVAKYCATIWGYYAVSRPFLSSVPNTLTTLTQEKRLESYYKSGRMLINLAQAIGRLVMNESKQDIKAIGNIVHTDNIIKFERVPIVTPNGDVLIKELNITIKSGENVLIAGPNGCGKSSLFRILGELWPLKSGTLTKPANSELFYVPQRPYMTIGTLRDQIIYPDNYTTMIRKGFSDEDIIELLRRVNLEWIVEWNEVKQSDDSAEENVVMGKRRSLDDVENWIDVLSGGQKQRIAMARLLYHKPQFAILDECTSAVSVDVEGAIYNYCREIGITLLTVTHRKSLWKYHEYVLHMDGRGSYTFQQITSQTEAYGS